jgi:hypothetical protein
MKKEVKWTKAVKIITAIVIVAVVVADYYFISNFIHSKEWILLVFGVGLTCLFLYFALESPRLFELTEEGVILHKIRGKVQISFAEINKVEPYFPNKDVRYFGSGGFFGYVGKFTNLDIGSYQAYVGDFKQAFLVQTENEKYVFSCENSDEITAKISQKIKK